MLSSKQCGKCKRTLPLSFFHKNRRTIDGLKWGCKPCSKKALHDWVDKNREHTRAYARIATRARRAKYGVNRSRPEVRIAHGVLNRAVAKGEVVRPIACSKCRREDMRIEAHHYLGYAPENHFDVQWLCSSCHWYADNPIGPLERKLDEMLTVLRAKA